MGVCISRTIFKTKKAPEISGSSSKWIIQYNSHLLQFKANHYFHFRLILDLTFKHSDVMRRKNNRRSSETVADKPHLTLLFNLHHWRGRVCSPVLIVPLFKEAFHLTPRKTNTYLSSMSCHRKKSQR